MSSSLPPFPELPPAPVIVVDEEPAPASPWRLIALVGVPLAVLVLIAAGLLVARSRSVAREDQHGSPTTDGATSPKRRSFAPEGEQQKALWPGAADAKVDPPKAAPTPAAQPAVVDLSRSQSVFKLVPEAADYTLVYALPLPDAARFNQHGVPYAVDNRAEIRSPFDRMAYFLELERDGSTPQYAYASFDAVTDDLSKVGVPCASTGVFWQMPVKNLHVFSNVEGVETGTELTGGIEFWHSNYGPGNTGQAPGAAEDKFDFGDARSNSGDYGSMQVHNYAAKQTILAYNNWGGGTGEAGIGNQPKGNPDWTFSHNIQSYKVRSLYVLVRVPKT